MIACENSGHESTYDFAEVSKIVAAGATSKPVKDYELSKYACYSVGKEVRVANALSCFCIFAIVLHKTLSFARRHHGCLAKLDVRVK